MLHNSTCGVVARTWAFKHSFKSKCSQTFEINRLRITAMTDFFPKPSNFNACQAFFTLYKHATSHAKRKTKSYLRGH